MSTQSTVIVIIELNFDCNTDGFALKRNKQEKNTNQMRIAISFEMRN